MLSKNIFYSVVAQIPIFILGVVSGVFSTRVLGEDAKGAFTLLHANSQLIVMLFSFGINTAIVYFISSKKKTPESVVGLTTLVMIVSTFLLSLILLITHSLNLTKYLLPENFSAPIYLLSLFIIFFLSFLSSNISSIFRADSKFKIINLISVFSAIINTLIFVFIYFLLDDYKSSTIGRFDIILMGTILGLLLTSLIWIIAYLKEIRIAPKFSSEIRKELKVFMLYSSSIFLGILINFFNYRLDLWIVNLMVDTKGLSHYSLASNLGQIILFVSVTISSVVLPYLSSQAENEKFQKFMSIIKLSFMFFLTITSLGLILSPYIIPLLYGDEFASAILTFQLILPGILLSCMTQLLAQLVISINRNILNIIACSIGLIFTIVLDLILIKKYGIIGASIATSIAYFMVFLSTYIFIIKRFGSEYWNIFIPSKQDIKTIKELIKNHR
jgi:O-antigen/teichoic acid export membrane protein